MTVYWDRMVFLPVNLIKKLPLILRQIKESRHPSFTVSLLSVDWEIQLLQAIQQMEKDKFECYNWAKGETGFDPMQSPQSSTPPPTQTTQSGRGGSVVRGAAVGGLAGSMGGEFGKDAAVGAAAGLVGGGYVSVVRPVHNRLNRTNGPGRRQQTITSSAVSITGPLVPAWKGGTIRSSSGLVNLSLTIKFS